MKIEEYLTLSCTVIRDDISHKKQLMTLISELACQGNKKLKPQNIFHALIERERIGNTYMGHHIAIPHARIKSLKKPLMILIKLNSSLSYGKNEEKADIIFSLLVPEEATDNHLSLLSQLAELLRSEHYRENLRKAENAEELHAIAIGENIPIATAMES